MMIFIIDWSIWVYW